MSIYGALRAGIAGLSANSNRIGMISDNIANTNTDGYKRVEAQFSTFVTEIRNGSNNQFFNGGVHSNSYRNISEQGALRSTSEATDLAVQGKGYFVVSKSIQLNARDEWVTSNPILFSRVGDFRSDSNGNLRNSDGHYLLAWRNNATGTQIDATTSLEDLSTVNVSKQLAKPIASTELSLGVNLVKKARNSTDIFTVQYELRDKKGVKHEVDIVFERFPAEKQNIHLSDGAGTITKEVSLGKDNAWRVYANFKDGTSLRSFDIGGNEDALVSGKSFPIADVVFDSQGKLGTVALPGALALYQHTNLPLNADNFTEDGSLLTQPYNFGNGVIRQENLNNIADILQESNIPAAAFNAPITESQILNGITVLDTVAYPDAMPRIMSVFNQDLAFQNGVARDNAGYPRLDGGIDSLLRHSLGGGDTPGAPAQGDPQGQNVLTSRLLNGATKNIDRIENVGNNQILALFANHPRTTVQITVDYDNNATTDDGIEIEIDLGGMNMNSLEAGGPLNRSVLNIPYSGVAANGNSGVTQYYDNISTVRFLNNNGKQASVLNSVEIDAQGNVQGSFANGEQRRLRQVPLVLFTNPNGLSPNDGRAFLPSIESGAALIRSASNSGAGGIIASSLESATVDIATEFSNMIITQRAYSASAKIISTTQAMLDELSQRF